jgi:putative Mg2+ transporter-C (MgtC) family protein
VGFLGAGVIFKDGVNVSGLTTAGIIWLAAAVGTSIGFGEFFLAITFMLASLVIVYSSPWINKLFRPKKQTRTLVISIDRENLQYKRQIIQDLKERGVVVEEKKLEVRNGIIIVSLDTIIRYTVLTEIEEYLVKHPHIVTFSI